MKNRFEATGTEKTCWVSESEFRFDSWMIKMTGLQMPGAFRKQSLQLMQNFKEFAENNKSVVGSATEKWGRQNRGFRARRPV